MGDIAAHQVGRVLRGAAGWGQRAGETVAANVKEYLQEESRDLVTRTEAAEFCAGVDTVSEAVDRLALRVQTLRQKN